MGHPPHQLLHVGDVSHHFRAGPPTVSAPTPRSGASLLVMAIIGGAVLYPSHGLVFQATHSIARAYMVPLLCYCGIALYSFVGVRMKRRKREELLGGSMKAILAAWLLIASGLGAGCATAFGGVADQAGAGFASARTS